MTRPSLRAVGAALLAAASWFVVGLALSRLLYEWQFPQWAALAHPGPALLIGLGTAVIGWALWRRLGAAVVWASLPLLLNLVWLVDPAVDLPRGRFLFAAGWWLAAVIWAWLRAEGERFWPRWGLLFVAVALLPAYLLTMSSAVGQADTFEFQVVAPQLGIAHPTGYPLYLLLGKLFSLLPLGTVAWRLNLASAVYATAAATVVFRLALELLDRPLPALAGAVALGLVPIFWGQAIVAEVYTLHALVVAVALWLMVRLTTARQPRPADRRKQVVALFAVIGLGLTNHLTSVFLLPPAALAVALRLHHDRQSGRRDLPVRPLMRLLTVAVAFTAPLLLYAYLPLRWWAIHDEPMGVGRFAEWVLGGRFQGALQPLAWLRDPARWDIVGRLLHDGWGWLYLTLALAGCLWLLWRQWRPGLVLLLTAAGFAFYALNYYVPDLAVFLIPVHVVLAIWLAALLAALEAGLLGRNPVSRAAAVLVFLTAMTLLLAAAGSRWSAVDRSTDDGGELWARAVLNQPLAQGAALLADSEKIAPLYYLHQIEGLRPDLEIMVLPDEAAYRAEIDARLAAGQPVYLARYMPGLAGVYQLRSAGPLVEVSREPLTALPAGVTPANMTVGPLQLVGYTVEPVAAVDDEATGLTLYWTLDESPPAGPPVIYLRWASREPVVAGVHAANDTYPLNAWRPGEVVADFHLLPLPASCAEHGGCPMTIEVAVGPRFAVAGELDWQPVTTLNVAPHPGPVGAARRLLFEGFALDGIDFPVAARLETRHPLAYSGHAGNRVAPLDFLLVPTHAVNSIIGGGDAPEPVVAAESRAFAAMVDGAMTTGEHALIALPAGEPRAVCGWLHTPTTGCVVAEVIVSGAPLPEGAANFGDRLALLDVAVDESQLVPGGQLPVTLTWQGLTEMADDYTVFVQVLDTADRIVGQVDAWPVQGTRPTSMIRPGEVVTDPYLVQLSPDLPPGDYRLHAGLYLLATGQRVPVVDEAGNAVDDKVEHSLSIE